MRKKIKNNLSVKVFLWVFFALTICSMLIYGIVMTVIPRQYQMISDRQLETDANKLFMELENITYDDALNHISNFCMKHNAAATLSNGDDILTFGMMDTSEGDTTTASYAANIIFTDKETSYMIAIITEVRASDGITALFFKMLPVIFCVILLLSLLSAFICSKVIVTPLKDDIKKYQHLEEQRRHFFAAASHELKTPLTILKGQLENMVMGFGDYQNHEKYLPQTLKAAEDMEYLVKEILSITKMESMDPEGTLEETSLLEMLEQIIKKISPLAIEKNIRIHQEILSDTILKVNPDLFQKALSNVIHNAVRYSPCGENVSIYTEPQKNILIVENTGITIPEEDLSQIFTPFYRTDKSRNKSTGGSGLGLYITKTILDLHRMDCRIENGENKVLFYIKL